MKTDIIIIEDPKLKRFPAFIRRLFAKKYAYQGLIQIDSNTGDLTICGDAIKWLDKLEVKTTSEKRADKLMFDFLNEKYPQYKPYIQLF
jgi:hypothetical protein